MSQASIVFFDGDFVPFPEARIHVLAPAVKYALEVHEGIAAYSAHDGSVAVFRLGDHIRRLSRSAGFLGIGMPYTADEVASLVREAVRRNVAEGGPDDFHIRISLFLPDPAGFIDDEGTGVLAIAPIRRGERNHGPLCVGISPWRRTPDIVMPPRVKASSNYVNSRLALLEARRSGYDDAILLTADGKLSEGPGYNIFLVRDGTLVTPSITDSILEGVTRDTMLMLADDVGIKHEARCIDLSELIFADEAFFCGTWKEIRPIASVSRWSLPSPVPGAVTSALQRLYMRLVRGGDTDREPWLTWIRI